MNKQEARRIDDRSHWSFVGIYKQAARKDVLKNGFESAAQQETWDYPEQEITLWVVDNHWICGTRKGTRTHYSYLNRLFTATHLDVDDVPVDMTDGVQFDSYNVGTLAAAGKIVLSEHWRLRLVDLHSIPWRSGASPSERMPVIPGHSQGMWRAVPDDNNPFRFG